jgi:hypothetical protein
LIDEQFCGAGGAAAATNDGDTYQISGPAVSWPGQQPVNKPFDTHVTLPVVASGAEIRPRIVVRQRR